MATPQKWSALGTFTLAIAGDASSPTLKNLADATLLLGNEIDWTADRSIYGLWQLRCRGASAFAASAAIYVWFILAADGTNYEDGAAGVEPLKAPDIIFPPRAVSTQQNITRERIVFPPSKFKPLVKNAGGVAFTNTNDENQLHYRPYNTEA